MKKVREGKLEGKRNSFELQKERLFDRRNLWKISGLLGVKSTDENIEKFLRKP